MADQEPFNILKQGPQVWNKWREEKQNSWEAPPYLPFENLEGVDLRGVDLEGADLVRADLSNANLTGANLTGANLTQADLQYAHLYRANLVRANLTEANLADTDLTEANLVQACLWKARLHETNLTGANLTEASLEIASLIYTNLTNAILTGCHVYGISVWNVNLEGAIQKDLVIRGDGKPAITVDDLEVAQFIYLMSNNQKIRKVIDTITSKVVLILGRFTDEREPVLDALRDELRKHNYSPIVFDFEPSAKRNLTETISLLANMFRFVIADLTDAKSIPQELERIIPHLPSVLVQPLLQKDATEYAMFESYKAYPWVLPICPYQDIPSLLASLKERILKPVEEKANEKVNNRKLEEEVKNKDEHIRKLEEEINLLKTQK